MGGPFCACAGTLAAISAAAVTSEMIVTAGVVRRGLLGLSLTVMSARLRTNFARNLVVHPNTVNALMITSDCGSVPISIVRANAARAGRVLPHHQGPKRCWTLHAV